MSILTCVTEVYALKTYRYLFIDKATQTEKAIQIRPWVSQRKKTAAPSYAVHKTA